MSLLGCHSGVSKMYVYRNRIGVVSFQREVGGPDAG